MLTEYYAYQIHPVIHLRQKIEGQNIKRILGNERKIQVHHDYKSSGRSI
jgi:hypothetical protein